jgi:hypothetical protein
MHLTLHVDANYAFAIVPAALVCDATLHQWDTLRLCRTRYSTIDDVANASQADCFNLPQSVLLNDVCEHPSYPLKSYSWGIEIGIGQKLL